MLADSQTIKPAVVTAIPDQPTAYGPQATGGVLWREIFFRSTAVLATGLFVFRASVAVALNPGRVTLLLMLLSESLSALLLLLSKVPKVRDTSPMALLCVTWAYIHTAFLGVDPGRNLIYSGIGVAICIGGMLLVIYAKLIIGTSFGLLPASREVVRRGPYRFIRHPIYVGYLITHVGFIASDFTWRNLMVLTTLYLCQFVRVLREEKVLGQEEAYRVYCRDVPYRFCYGLI